MLTFRVYLQCACSLYTWGWCLWGKKVCSTQVWTRQLWLLWLYIGQKEYKIKLQAASSYEPVAVIPQIFSYNLLLYKFSFWKPESTSNALEIVSETSLDGIFYLMPVSKTWTWQIYYGLSVNLVPERRSLLLQDSWPNLNKKSSYSRFSSKWDNTVSIC